MNYAEFVDSKTVQLEDEHSTIWSPVIVRKRGRLFHNMK